MFALLVCGQSTKQVEVEGIIMSKNNDVEGVTIFNKSSNNGTITNEKGAFSIKVALNDVLEIAALQFQLVSVTIDETVLKSKQLKIQLIEQVNKLNTVTISSGLTGNFVTDIDNVKIVKLRPLDLGNINAFDMSEDKIFDKRVVQDHLQSIINPNARKYLPDIIKIFNLLTKSKVDLSLKKNLFVEHVYEKPKTILDVYTYEKIGTILNIAPEDVKPFIAFIENQEINEALLKPENELQLVDFLLKQTNQFFKN